MVQLCSPSCVINRTFKITFQYKDFIINEPKKKLIPKKQYTNPIYLAKELKSKLDNGEYRSQSELSKHLGFSRARVTQILNLLNLNKSVLEKIESLGNPIDSQIITERKLRGLLKLSKFR